VPERRGHDNIEGEDKNLQAKERGRQGPSLMALRANQPCGALILDF